MSNEIIHVAGRYNKYRRNLSQSPWLQEDDVRIKNSVQELIEEGISKFIKYESISFSACGREDVDVRMLGKGRPFVFKIHHAHEPSSITDSILRQAEEYVNTTHGKDIKVRDLQLVTKSSVSKNLNEGQEFKSKEYRALCCSSRKLTCDEIEKINNLTELNLEQKTPIRVLHRRTMATRNRKIHHLRIDPVNLEEFDCVKAENLDQVFALTLMTEAGTYIKEFVHGDFGRTKPNLSSLIGSDCETDLIELDVMEVYLDWPPSLNKVEPSAGQQTCPVSEKLSEKMDNSEQALAELYTGALKSMQSAETLPRGDDRQHLYIRSRQMFERASELVESIALFSDNETIDDIATADLKYLLIPAYQAKIYLSAECSPNRLDTYTRAELLIIKFFNRLMNYGLGNEQIQRVIKSEGFLSGDVQRTTSVDLQAAMRERNEKIEKFKRMKVLESRVEELERRINSGQEVDDELNREYYLKMIDKWIEDSLESLEREVRPAIFFERNRPTDMDGPVVRPQPRAGSSKGLGACGRPYTIVKNDLQKQVFGLGYPSRPTVTVDEFITKKLADGDLAFEAHKEVYSNSLQRYAEDPGLRRDQEEKSDEERDAKEDCDDEDELARKRRWDEFKDDNPRGSGNRHNMG